MNKNKIYDGIFWLSMITMIVWVILKVAGVFNTPPLIESIPTISTVFAAGVFYQKMSTMEEKLKDIGQELRNIDK